MEFPHLQEIYARYAGEEFTILSVETTNRPQLAREMIDEFGATFPVVVDEERVAGEKYGLIGVPTTWMVDRQGRIVFRHLGFSPGDEEMLRAEVELLLRDGIGAPEGSASL